jgi:hypothetical protein
MTPYLTVPFKLDSINWVQDFMRPIVADFQVNAPHTNALVQLSEEQLAEFRSGPAWSEIQQFANTYGLSDPFPQLFIYKHLDKPRVIILGNPHIDTAGEDGISTKVCIRFNILLNGIDATEMVWWNIDQNDDRVVNHQFERPDHSYAGRLQAWGNTLQQQWANIGAPDYRARYLAKTQEYASFVRTDILHALNWAGKDARLVLSIKFDNSWDEIERIRAQLNNTAS